MDTGLGTVSSPSKGFWRIEFAVGMQVIAEKVSERTPHRACPVIMYIILYASRFPLIPGTHTPGPGGLRPTAPPLTLPTDLLALCSCTAQTLWPPARALLPLCPFHPRGQLDFQCPRTPDSQAGPPCTMSLLVATSSKVRHLFGLLSDPPPKPPDPFHQLPGCLSSTPYYDPFAGGIHDP